MSTARTAAALAAAAAALVVAAAPAQAAPARTVVDAHVQVAGVAGALPVGAGVSLVQTCPKGSTLDATATRIAGEAHDPRLAVASREYWPAGMVTRYRVAKRLSAADPALVATTAVCRTAVARSATTVDARASADLRVWGPAPAKVDLTDVAVVAVTDRLDSAYVFRSSMKAAGVTSQQQSLSGAVEAVQERIADADGEAVVAEGRTLRTVGRGEFISMKNQYRFVAHLDEKVTVV